jgi:hypothetical protein
MARLEHHVEHLIVLAEDRRRAVVWTSFGIIVWGEA